MTNILAASLYQYQKYITLDGHVWSVHGYMINEKLLPGPLGRRAEGGGGGHAEGHGHPPQDDQRSGQERQGDPREARHGGHGAHARRARRNSASSRSRRSRRGRRRRSARSTWTASSRPSRRPSCRREAAETRRPPGCRSIGSRIADDGSVAHPPMIPERRLVVAIDDGYAAYDQEESLLAASARPSRCALVAAARPRRSPRCAALTSCWCASRR